MRWSRTAAKWVFVSTMGLGFLHSQTRVDLSLQSKNPDFSNAAWVKPFRTGTVLPGTCSVGEAFLMLNVTPGASLYLCTATNTWAVQGGSGDNLPDQTGHGNHVLATDGMSAAWRSLVAGLSGALQITHGTSQAEFDIVTPAVPLKSAANAWTGTNSWKPTANQSITQAGDVVLCNGNAVQVTPSGSLTLTSTPTIQNGVDGQYCLIVNLSPENTLTLQDETVLVGSNLRLAGRANQTIAPRGTLLLQYSASLGDWVQVGGSSGLTQYLTFLAATCSQGSASEALQLPSSNAPTPTCVEGTNTIYGTLSFAENGTGTAQSVQLHLPLLPDWTGQIDVEVRWRTSATAGDVVWQLQTACVADGETGDPNFSAPQTITDTAKGGANQFNDASLTNLTTTGCAAGKELFVKFARDATHTSDTLAAAAELIWVRFKIRRS